MNKKLEVIILAAGRGTRMYSQLPKVLHKIGGKPMLQHVIDTAQSLNPEKIHVVIGYGKDTVRHTIHSDVNWVEQSEQLGTAHAVSMAVPFLRADTEQVLVLYGDVPLINTETLQELITLEGDGVVLLTDTLDNPTGYGRIIRKDNYITQIVEEKDANPEQKSIQEVNTGIMRLPAKQLSGWLSRLSCDNAQGEYYLTDVVSLSVQDNIPVYGVGVAEHYLATGVNNKLQQSALERQFQYNQAEQLMAKGISLLDPMRFDLRGTLDHGQDVEIDVNVLIEGHCQLGNGVKIGANCVLKNVQLADGVEIRPFSHLENCCVGAGAVIGPFARLRPDAVLGEGVHIGNFVEVKKSNIGNGTKVNHLTYIGDTQIGQNTNIGAGTITCNYNGVEKFRTVIGSDVRIGSGTMLVAPVEVGDKATTGAGSVITKNCPDNKLTLSRSKQTTIDSWVRPEKSSN